MTTNARLANARADFLAIAVDAGYPNDAAALGASFDEAMSGPADELIERINSHLSTARAPGSAARRDGALRAAAALTAGWLAR